MAEKILNTRIQLKYDTLSNWQGSAFNGNDPTKYLKAGEVAIVTLAPNAETNPTATANQHPLLMKVGTGSHKFDALPWVSGLAADVYAWAKKATPDWADFPALPIEVVDEGTGKFVTDFTYVNNKLTITRADAVNSLTPTDDDIVILTVDKTTGDITIDGKHKEYNKAGTTTDTDSNLTTAGQEITVKIPKLSVDKYGHTEFNGETTHTIKLPGEIAVGDGDITIEAGKGLTTGGTFNVNQDTDSTITLNHQDAPTTGNAAVVKTGGTGRTYVTEVLVDDMGHIAGVKTATESDQDLGDYKTKQAEKSGTLTGAEVLGTWSQNANGEVTITSRILTAADLGLDTVMHFIGAYATAPTKAFAGTANERALANGDVYLNTANATEYVYSGGKWVELGNESAAGSHALKTVTITGTDGLEGGGDLSANRQIKHAVPTGAIEGKTTPNTAQTPAHGETFNIPVVKTDKFGHIIEKTTTTVKIPDLPTPADIGAVESVSFEAGIVVTKDADDAPTIPGFKLTVDGEDQLVEMRAGNGVTISADNANTADNDAASWLQVGLDIDFVDGASLREPESAPAESGSYEGLGARYGVNIGNETLFGVADSDTLSAAGGWDVDAYGRNLISFEIKDKAVTTAKIADHAVGAHQTKACVDYKNEDGTIPEDAEVWVFNCGSATVNV